MKKILFIGVFFLLCIVSGFSQTQDQEIIKEAQDDLIKVSNPNDTTFKKTTAIEYFQVFFYDNGNSIFSNDQSMHEWVLDMLKKCGQNIVPGCVATLKKDESGRLQATSQIPGQSSKVTQDINGRLSIEAPKAVPGGSIYLKYTSNYWEYDYYDFGKNGISWERFSKKFLDGTSTLKKGIIKDGFFYIN